MARHGSGRLLRQALKLREGATYSELKALVEAAAEYARKEGEMVLYARPRERVRIVDEAAFWRFVAESTGLRVDSFEALEAALDASSRRENIEATGDSKRTAVAPFSKTVLLRRAGEVPRLYRPGELPFVDGEVLAVENAESFLEAEALAARFDAPWHLYLGGNPNRAVRDFLRQQRVRFFIDWDIVSMNLFDDLECAAKALYLPEDFNALVVRYGNRALYEKQRYLLRERYGPETAPVIAAIRRRGAVLEQEIVR